MEENKNVNLNEEPEVKPLTGFRWFWKKYLRRYIIWTVLILGMLFLLYVGAYGGYKTMPADKKTDMYTNMAIILGLWILADVTKALIMKKVKVDNNKKLEQENAEAKKVVRIEAGDSNKNN